MNHSLSTKTLALASVALLALAGCGSKTTSSKTTSSTSPSVPDTTSTPATSATPAASTSAAKGPTIEAGGYTDASLTKILVGSGTTPQVATASQLATVHGQAPQQIAGFKAATFTPAPCGKHFVDYAGAVAVSGARADGRTAKPVEMVALVAKSNVQEATDAVAAFEQLATECKQLSVKPGSGQAQQASFAKLAAPTVAGADQVVVGTMTSGGGSRRIELARVNNVLVQVTSEVTDSARADKTLTQVVEAVVANPAK